MLSILPHQPSVFMLQNMAVINGCAIPIEVISQISVVPSFVSTSMRAGSKALPFIPIRAGMSSCGRLVGGLRITRCPERTDGGARPTPQRLSDFRPIDLVLVYIAVLSRSGGRQDSTR